MRVGWGKAINPAKLAAMGVLEMPVDEIMEEAAAGDLGGAGGELGVDERAGDAAGAYAAVVAPASSPTLRANGAPSNFDSSVALTAGTMAAMGANAMAGAGAAAAAIQGGAALGIGGSGGAGAGEAGGSASTLVAEREEEMTDASAKVEVELPVTAAVRDVIDRLAKYVRGRGERMVFVWRKKS